MNMLIRAFVGDLLEDQDAHVVRFRRATQLTMLDDARNAQRRAQWCENGYRRTMNKLACRYCVERAREIRLEGQSVKKSLRFA